MQDLYFIASKLVGFFISPLHLLAVFILAWGVAFWMRSRYATFFSIITVASTLMLGATPIWNALLYTHETQMTAKDPREIEGIIVLGGAFNEIVTEAHNQVSLNGAGERMTETVRLMRQYPTVPIIFSGFSGRLVRGTLSESDVALRFFNETVGSTERIILENQSRNTFENAIYTKELIDFAGSQPWLLVTSASHMPRAFEIFNDRGIRVIPYPVDFRSRIPSTEFRWNLSGGSSALNILLHEWIGLWTYRLTQKPST